MDRSLRRTQKILIRIVLVQPSVHLPTPSHLIPQVSLNPFHLYLLILFRYFYLINFKVPHTLVLQTQSGIARPNTATIAKFVHLFTFELHSISNSKLI